MNLRKKQQWWPVEKARLNHHVRIVQSSKDLNRYLVDKFHQPNARSKTAPFESIDLSIYRPSANCLAFSTSEDRLLLWITAFQYRYHKLTGNAADYKVIWEEQDSLSSASKCDKIIIHLITNASTGEEQLVAITVFVTTGRILVQGKNSKNGAASSSLCSLISSTL